MVKFLGNLVKFRHATFSPTIFRMVLLLCKQNVIFSYPLGTEMSPALGFKSWSINNRNNRRHLELILYEVLAMVFAFFVVRNVFWNYLFLNLTAIVARFSAPILDKASCVRTWSHSILVILWPFHFTGYFRITRPISTGPITCKIVVSWQSVKATYKMKKKF